jgi:hypothetical protein
MLLKVNIPRSPLPAFIAIGGELAFILSHKEFNWPEKNLLKFDMTKSTRNFDAGLILGAGVEFGFKGISLGVEARYHYGLVDTTHYLNDWHNIFNTREIVVLGTLGFSL